MWSKAVTFIVWLAAAQCNAFSLSSWPLPSHHAHQCKPLFAAGDTDDKREDPKRRDLVGQEREAPGEPRFDTSVFGLPIDVKYDYDDNAKSMAERLPALLEQCKQLEDTPLGKKYAARRLPIYILGCKKLKGTLSQSEYEGETFQFLLKLVEQESAGAIQSIPREGGEEGRPIPWDEDGDNSSPEAWNEQCRCHLRALVMMLDWAKAGELLTTEKMLLCHNELMRGSVTREGAIFESRYRYKDEPVFVGNVEFPKANNQEESMAKILEEMEARFGKQHPVQWSCDFLLNVLAAHPFLNGNGRMSRLCYAYGLVRHGVPCAVVFSNWHSKSRKHWVIAIEEATGENRWKWTRQRERLYTIGTVGLYNTLQDMRIFCE